MTTQTQSNLWVDTNEYPFEHHYVHLRNGTMHYIDEGAGEVILFVHGTPAWSFLYREFVKTLSGNYRCIAVDHIGFGLSEKPEKFSGTPEDHARNLSEFIRKLDLRDITLVVHDFGGPIGLAGAIDEPERIKRIVMFNTWLWETGSNPEARKVDKLINGSLGKFLYLRMNFSPRILLKQAFDNKKNLTKHIHKQYIRPFPNKNSRLALLNLAKSLVGSSDWYQEQWEKLSAISDKPWLILWGTKDRFITTDFLGRWMERLPHARVKEFDCGHFVQEEKGDEALGAISEFLSAGKE